MTERTDIASDAVRAIRTMCEDPANRRDMTLRQACLLLDAIRGHALLIEDELAHAEERNG